MAKLVTETFTITLSKMVKNTEDAATIIDGDTLASLETVITELAGEGVMVEIE